MEANSFSEKASTHHEVTGSDGLPPCLKVPIRARAHKKSFGKDPAPITTRHCAEPRLMGGAK